MSTDLSVVTNSFVNDDGDRCYYSGVLLPGSIALTDHAAAQARITALQAELEATQKDAERYRALRASLDSKARRSLHMPQISDPLNSFLLTYTPKGFDEAVDAAMASSDTGRQA